MHLSVIGVLPCHERISYHWVSRLYLIQSINCIYLISDRDIRKYKKPNTWSKIVMICGEFLGYYHLSKLKEIKSSLYLIKKKPSQMLFMEIARVWSFFKFFLIFTKECQRSLILLVCFFLFE